MFKYIGQRLTLNLKTYKIQVARELCTSPFKANNSRTKNIITFTKGVEQIKYQKYGEIR